MKRQELQALLEYNCTDRSQYNAVLAEALESAYDKLPGDEQEDVYVFYTKLRERGLTKKAALELLYAVGCLIAEQPELFVKEKV